MTVGAARPPVDRTARRDQVRAHMVAKQLHALLVLDAADVRYLSGFAGSNGQVLLTATGDDRLITDGRYEGPARALGDLDVEVSRDPLTVAAHAVPGGAIGVDDGSLSWADARRWHPRAEAAGVQLVAVSDPVGPAREVKDEVEVATLAEACAITVTALEELLTDRVRVGVTERQLATDLERRFLDLGAEGVAFSSIVASGPNAAVPHHTPTDRALRPGDVLTIDCGARVDGYHADCTRTVAIGHLDGPLDEVHALIERSQAAGRAAATAGVAAGEVDRACREVIAAAGYGDRFVHGTGHGVGLDIHERPAVARNASATLRPGTTLTVEPGVYLPGIGGVRIEDTIVVTADGAPRVLTDTPRELRVL